MHSAERHGMVLDAKDTKQLEYYRITHAKTDSDYFYALVDKAEQYMNTKAPEGYVFGWNDGDFVLEPILETNE